LFKCSVNQLLGRTSLKHFTISWPDLFLAEDSDFVAGESGSDSDNALE